jgi:hypothetical protein
VFTAEQLAVAESWPGAENVRACTVKIGRSTYEGFSYGVPKEWGKNPHRAANERRFYLLADEPPPSTKRNAVYRIDGDWTEGDWYFGGHVTPEAAADPRLRAFHPLGAHFLLMRWPHEQFGERIDHYDERPLLRKRMRIQVVYADS